MNPEVGDVVRIADTYGASSVRLASGDVGVIVEAYCSRPPNPGTPVQWYVRVRFPRTGHLTPTVGWPNHFLEPINAQEGDNT